MEELEEKVVFRTGLYSKAAQEALDFAFDYHVNFNDLIPEYSYVVGSNSKCRREEDGEICFIFCKSILKELFLKDDIVSYMKTRFNEFANSLRKELLFNSDIMGAKERRLCRNALTIFKNVFSKKKNRPKRFIRMIGKPLDPFSAAALVTLENEYQRTIIDSIDIYRDKTKDYDSKLIALRTKMEEIYKLLDRE